MVASLRCAIVGPGRTRDGLGPFLARFLEDAGVAVVGGIGRDPRRTMDACARLAVDLGHPVAAFDDVSRALDELRPDALVIASPPASHGPALEAAARAGVHVLCEKPFVCERDSDVVDALLAQFSAVGRIVVENCQWPFVLAAFDALHPRVRQRDVRALTFRLSPSGMGRTMLEDSLSHLLSLVQALVPPDLAGGLADVAIAGGAADAEACDVELRFGSVRAGFRARLELRRQPTQPRTAWLEIDGHRAERRIRMPDYRLSLAAPDDRSVEVEDPMRALVYGFATLLREPDVDRSRAESERIRQRTHLYREILARWRD